MATTQIADLIVPEVYKDYMLNKTKMTKRLIEHGIMRKNEKLEQFIKGAGRTVNVPFLNDLPQDSANISSDDPASDAVPKKISSGKDVAIRHSRNQHFQTADLAAELTGADPAKMIADRFNNYWDLEFQRCLVATLRGVFADNIANDNGDMVENSSADLDKVSITDADRISPELIIDARAQMLEHDEELGLIAMHPLTKAFLQKNNLIDYVPDSEGKIRFPTYLGMDVIVSRACPIIAGSNQSTYWTFLLGRGALCFHDGMPRVPFAYDRNELGGDGGGIETISSRRQFLLHPSGIKFTDSSVAGESPTDTELQNAANWDRVYAEREQVPMVLIRHNL